MRTHACSLVCAMLLAVKKGLMRVFALRLYALSTRQRAQFGPGLDWWGIELRVRGKQPTPVESIASRKSQSKPYTMLHCVSLLSSLVVLLFENARTHGAEPWRATACAEGGAHKHSRGSCRAAFVVSGNAVRLGRLCAQRAWSGSASRTHHAQERCTDSVLAAVREQRLPIYACDSRFHDALITLWCLWLHWQCGAVSGAS
jgi:hypothetical protein